MSELEVSTPGEGIGVEAESELELGSGVAVLGEDVGVSTGGEAPDGPDPGFKSADGPDEGSESVVGSFALGGARPACTNSPLTHEYMDGS